MIDPTDAAAHYNIGVIQYQQRVVEVFTPLKTLLAAEPGACQMIGVGEPLQAFHLQCPLTSLRLMPATTLAVRATHRPRCVARRNMT
ncbi:MAG: hypothetical protein ABI293_03125 [Rhodanobacter sp.]